MRKTIKEKQEIEVDVTYEICDACNNKVPMNTAMLTIKVSIPRDHSETKEEVSEINICSPECLVKNAKGIHLILETQHMAKAREAAKKEPSVDTMTIDTTTFTTGISTIPPQPSIYTTTDMYKSDPTKFTITCDNTLYDDPNKL